MVKKRIDRQTIDQKYKTLYSQYEKLGSNLAQAIELLLKENSIPFLSINYRVKDVDSFIGKIEKKNYINPFEEIEDICGLRVICFYQSDITKIESLVKKELVVLENEDKSDKLEFDQFGYRSLHFIIKVPEQWQLAPNYRGLENLKAELQVRTVLMHAWAEIEHKLAYKSKSQIPKEFRRKLSRISAKLEEADEQFEDIKREIDTRKEQVISTANDAKQFNPDIEFNLDNLQAFLDFAFSDRAKDIKSTVSLFDEMAKYSISLKELVEGYNKTKSLIRKIEKEGAEMYESKNDFYWAQVGAARTILELVNDDYFNSRQDNPDVGIIKKYR